MPASQKEGPNRETLTRVAELFRVFSEPTRLAILQFLRERSMSVNELVERLETSQANVSKQLKTLYEADLLHREQRGNQVFYSIKEEMVYELCAIVCDKLNRTARASAEIVYQI
ncbi:MAG: winged helix-turn-helix transcriptional regulator [Verrucomicrobiae bacterium]|nr:winged helix-turn-helix transcriptional regulator [Verrucomicrobiae bacterium]